MRSKRRKGKKPRREEKVGKSRKTWNKVAEKAIEESPLRKFQFAVREFKLPDKKVHQFIRGTFSFPGFIFVRRSLTKCRICGFFLKQKKIDFIIYYMSRFFICSLRFHVLNNSLWKRSFFFQLLYYMGCFDSRISFLSKSGWFLHFILHHYFYISLQNLIILNINSITTTTYENNH